MISFLCAENLKSNITCYWNIRNILCNNLYRKKERKKKKTSNSCTFEYNYKQKQIYYTLAARDGFSADMIKSELQCLLSGEIF